MEEMQWLCLTTLVMDMGQHLIIFAEEAERSASIIIIVSAFRIELFGLTKCYYDVDSSSCLAAEMRAKLSSAIFLQKTQNETMTTATAIAAEEHII